MNAFPDALLTDACDDAMSEVTLITHYKPSNECKPSFTETDTAKTNSGQHFMMVKFLDEQWAQEWMEKSDTRPNSAENETVHLTDDHCPSACADHLDSETPTPVSLSHPENSKKGDTVVKLPCAAGDSEKGCTHSGFSFVTAQASTDGSCSSGYATESYCTMPSSCSHLSATSTTEYFARRIQDLELDEVDGDDVHTEIKHNANATRALDLDISTPYRTRAKMHASEMTHDLNSSDSISGDSVPKQHCHHLHNDWSKAPQSPGAYLTDDEGYVLTSLSCLNQK